MVISNNDKNNNNGEGAHEGTSTEVVQQKTNAVAASSPISDAGTWEIVDHGDTN